MFTEDAVVLIDADSLFFKICCVEKNKMQIRKFLHHSIWNLQQDCLSDNILIAVKGKGNFRHDVYPQYKANRKELDPELKAALNYTHSYIVNDMGAIQADGMEADDLISIWAYEAMSNQRDYTIASIDKDLLQIPGPHFNYQKRTFQYVDYDQGNYNLMKQCLTGDTSDNIPGIRGIGPKKAAAILEKTYMPHARWKLVKKKWREHEAGCPFTTYRLLKLLQSWEELDHVRDVIKNKTPVNEYYVPPEPKQDLILCDLPIKDLRSDEGKNTDVALREE